VNQEINPPKGFIVDVYEREFYFPIERITSAWTKLQRRETFTQGQLFPYRVEFASKSQEGEFLPGELNIHHGPFLSVHGAIGVVTPSYRSLHYFYGSYVLSFRLIRPVVLEFFRDDHKLKLKFKVYIRPWLRPLWRFINFLMWSGFRFSLSRLAV
jgi:hypothetical protein